MQIFIVVNLEKVRTGKRESIRNDRSKRIFKGQMCLSDCFPHSLSTLPGGKQVIDNPPCVIFIKNVLERRGGQLLALNHYYVSNQVIKMPCYSCWNKAWLTWQKQGGQVVHKICTGFSLLLTWKNMAFLHFVPRRMSSLSAPRKGL